MSTHLVIIVVRHQASFSGCGTHPFSMLGPLPRGEGAKGGAGGGRLCQSGRNTCDLVGRGGDVLHLAEAQLSPTLLGGLHEGLGQLLGMHLSCAALIAQGLHHSNYPLNLITQYSTPAPRCPPRCSKSMPRGRPLGQRTSPSLPPPRPNSLVTAHQTPPHPKGHSLVTHQTRQMGTYLVSTFTPNCSTWPKVPVACRAVHALADANQQRKVSMTQQHRVNQVPLLFAAACNLLAASANTTRLQQGNYGPAQQAAPG